MYIYQALKISKRKLTLLKTKNKVGNGLAKSRSQTSNIKKSVNQKLLYNDEENS